MRRINRLIAICMSIWLIVNMLFVNNVAYAKTSNTNVYKNSNMTNDNIVDKQSCVTDYSISGQDSIGNMIQNKIDESESVGETDEISDYKIYSVEMLNGVAEVSYKALSDCLLVVALYSEDGMQMHMSESKNISADDKNTVLNFDIESMPEYYLLRAYLVDSTTYQALSLEYENTMYTKDMQEFLAYDVDDFDAEKVVNFDDDITTNFAVLGDDTIIIPYNEGYNIVQTIDEDNSYYEISNPDEKFCSLISGDLFSYEYEDGRLMVVKVASVEIVDGILVIRGEDTSLEEAFDYVCIEIDDDFSDATIDSEGADESVSLIGQGDISQIATLNQGGFDEDNEENYIGHYGNLNTLGNSDIEPGTLFQIGKDEDEPIVKGTVGIKFDVSLNIYTGMGQDYVEFKLETKAGLNLTISKEIDFIDFELFALGKSIYPGVYIEIAPTLFFKADGEVSFGANLMNVSGFRATWNGIKDISEDPTIEFKFDVKGEVSIGIDLKPRFKIISDNVAKLEYGTKFACTLTLNDSEIKSDGENIKHECLVCFEGDLKFTVSLSATVKLLNSSLLECNLNIAEFTRKLSDVHYSPTFDHFGFTKCPYIKYRITVQAIDENEKGLPGVTVFEDYVTGEDGRVTFYLPNGYYDANPIKDGYIYLPMLLGKTRVNEKAKNLTFLMLPENGGSGGDGEISTGNIIIDETTFPDDNFRYYVQNWIDIDEDGVLSDAEISVTTNIECQGCQISDFTGVNYFYNLEYLECGWNNVSILDVSGCENLEYLSCEGNSLTSLDASGCTNLEYLYCFYNNLASLDISGCANLKYLLCYNNNLANLDVSGCSNLEDLYFGSNNLTNLNVSGCENLGYLSCEGNSLTSLDVSGCTNLGYLSCEGNSLTSLDVSGCTNLEHLYCYNNNISSLNVSDCISLKSLLCNGNNLSKLDVSNCSNLKSIKCDAGVNVVGKNANATITYVSPTSTANLLNNTGDISLHATVDEAETDDKNEQIFSTYQSATTASTRTIHQVTTADDNHIDYTDLYPNEIYNLYVVKESATDIPFGDVLTSDNLLYIRQYTSDGNGELNIDYLPIEEYVNATEILVCSKRRDISEGYDIRISNLIYTGEEQAPTIEVKYGEELLTEGKDYELEGDFYVTDIGDYTVSITGIGIYEGGVDIGYSVLVPVVNVELIELTTTELSLEKGENQIITYTVLPSDATDKTLTWISSDETVAVVDSTGKVTALKAGTTTITATANDSSGVSASCTVTVTEPVVEEPDEPTTEEPTPDTPKSYPTINTSYRTHIQSFGWEGNASDIKTWKSNGTMSGTSGKAKRLEGINIVVNSAETDKDVDLGIQYTTHCQSYGWLPWSADGDMNGTEGEAKRLEAIKIQLTGADKDAYDVYYRVHAQSYGWLGWAKNGEPSGTAGYGKRLEGIQIVVVKKEESFNQKLGGITSAKAESYIAKEGSSPIVNYPATSNKNPVIPGADTPNVTYRTHVQSFGWQGWKYNGQMSGTSGLAKRLEGINIKLTNAPYKGDIVYTTHVQKYGWKDGKPEADKSTWKKNGEMSGTNGEAKRLEAICIDLTGEMAEHYDIYYRVHAQTFGWLGWAKNGEESGTAGYAKRLEGIQIVLVPKGDAAPANNYGGITSKDARAYISK